MTALRQLPKLGIMKIDELAKQLGVEPAHLERMAKRVEHKHYRKEIDKGNGKVRVLEPPRDDLKALQRRIKDLLLRQQLPEYFTGGLPGRSAHDNAQAHLGQPFVQPLDLQDFFPSITNKQVYSALVRICGCSPDVAGVLTRLTTYSGHVPQGSPTSCIVAAIVLLPTAERLKKLANRNGWEFTVFVDDLTISGPPWIERFKQTMIQILEQDGFRPHSADSDKAKGMHRRQEQSVTGFKVNGQKLALTRKHREKLFGTLRRLEADEATSGQPPTKKEVQGLLGLARHICTIDKRVGNSVLFSRRVRLWKALHRC